MKLLCCGVLLCSLAARAAEVSPPPAESWLTRRVHLLSDDQRVELHRRAAGGEIFVCKTPCNTAVQFRPSDQFVLTGAGIRASTPFLLQRREDDLTLNVSAGSTDALILGGLLVGAGVLTIGAGTTSGIAAKFGDALCDDPRCAASNASTQKMALAVTLTGVAVALVGGAIVTFATHPTRFSSDP
jgi:hypothetical protein